MVTFGSQASQRGSHQFQSPRSVIVAGRRTERMSVASMNTATDSPRPSCWMNANLKVTKTANTTTMIEAALVIVPEVTEMPRATARRESSPRSRASLMRVRMNRW
jgi:hypothetical protein